ncbi:hypothetical protein BABINDRAFT_7177 [Babjeviella inositovora NRRL Y-12698]|uniref:Uncharacterized protein n=1 Tax=Babjeviella inositovora NRRL Y-12698 TaxID=984486 RepID=A0A1E3QUN3_9ASCO|nr:uncharacterized protein BABINDRAFT_7177 [Babjeviella inositovora NRRL Y-12698]ODQ81381.1 hypothetical protein BABINDRAFT_7177 [Babjeviella inositovora NRRL Y-12698]
MFFFQFLNLHHTVVSFVHPGISIIPKRPATDRGSPQPLPYIDAQNASAVFNTIHGVLKQKSNDLGPVGVSFFPAFLPQGTFLYHGNWNGRAPRGLEWVALDWEFSYNFAQFPRRYRPSGPSPPLENPNSNNTGNGTPPLFLRELNASLLTFQTLKPWTKLVYLDGASAAKSTTGEMDQQFLLAKTKFDPTKRVGERMLAEKICEWGKPFGLDGVIRLEIGYEIIVCDFSDQVERGGMKLIAHNALPDPVEVIGFPEEVPGASITSDKGKELALSRERSLIVDAYEAMAGYEHIRAASLVYNREKKVLVDYSKMVTPLNKTWISPDTYRRRIHNISEELRDKLILDLEAQLIDADGRSFIMGTDWQLITERVVEKFGPILMIFNQTYTNYLHSSNPEEERFSILARNISTHSFTFFRRYSPGRDHSSPEKWEAAKQAMIDDYSRGFTSLLSESDILIASSVNKIMNLITSEIFAQFEFSKSILKDIYVEEAPLKHHALEAIHHFNSLNALLDLLQWTLDYRCSTTCGWDQFCFIPSWGPGPFGWVSTDGTSPRNDPKEEDIPGFEYTEGLQLPAFESSTQIIASKSPKLTKINTIVKKF